MKKIDFLFLFISVFIFSSQCFSLPRFSLRSGFQCKDCHFNPTGRIVRNEGGWSYGKNNLPMMSSRNFEMNPKLNENISLGFDIRTQYLYSQELKRSDFHKMSASFYTNIDLYENINVVGRYDFIQRIWEGYGILKIFPNDGYLKIGTFNPTFGIRLDDHTSYTRGGDFNLLFSAGTRQGLIYNPFYLETGIEAGFYFSDFSFLTLSAGQNNYPFLTDPTYTARLELTPSIGPFNLLLGGSYGAYRDSLQVKMIGGFFGFSFNRITLLAEYDIMNNYLGRDLKSNALMVEASFRIMKGLETVARYDHYVPLTDKSDVNFSHLIFGF